MTFRALRKLRLNSVAEDLLLPRMMAACMQFSNAIFKIVTFETVTRNTFLNMSLPYNDMRNMSF